MDFLRQTINVLADLLITLIFIRIVLSWIVKDHHNKLMQIVTNLTEPILGPIRRAMPRFGMFDLSPIIAYFLIKIIRDILNQIL